MWRWKKSMVWIILLFALTAVFCLWFDFNVYESRSKTISCEDDGIIFSITTFNGDSETTKPRRFLNALDIPGFPLIISPVIRCI